VPMPLPNHIHPPGVSIARPRNDASMIAHQSPANPNVRRLLRRSEDKLGIAALIAVEGGDNDQPRCFVLGQQIIRHERYLSAEPAAR
jgi:hypothetical protein